jgi:Ni,Fe-hydrogenase maturation factor
VFADATAEGGDEPALVEIGPSAAIAFTTHAMSPASVLALCHEIFGRTPRAYVLAVRGYDWEMGEGLSERARANLAKAAEVLRRFLREQP